MTKLRYLITSLLAISLSLQLVGQNSKTQLLYRDGDKSKGIEKIVFKGTNGVIKAEFDVEANNPYSNLLKQATPTNDPTWRNTYEIKPTKVRSLIQESANLKSNSILDQEVKFLGTQVRRLSNGKGKICGLIHNILFFDKYREIKYSSAKLQLLNEDGSLKKELSPKTDINVAVVTNNEKYIGITYGGTVDHNGYQVYENGFSVYDMDKEILSVKSNDSQSFAGVFTRINEMLIFEADENGASTYFVVIPSSRLYYKKSYSLNRIGGLEIDSLGFILRDGTHDLFEEVFEKITF